MDPKGFTQDLCRENNPRFFSFLKNILLNEIKRRLYKLWSYVVFWECPFIVFHYKLNGNSYFFYFQKPYIWQYFTVK